MGGWRLWTALGVTLSIATGCTTIGQLLRSNQRTQPPIVVPTLGPQGSGGDAAALKGTSIPESRMALATIDLTPYSTPAGPSLGVSFSVEKGSDVIRLGAPLKVGSVAWTRTYVLPATSGAGPDDFFAWVPMVLNGQATLADGPAPGCPEGQLDLATIARLDPFSQLRCIGAAPVRIQGTTWDQIEPVWYDATPDWLGGPNQPGDHSFSIHAGSIQYERGPGEAARFLDVALPPSMAEPPRDFVVSLDAHYADAASVTCRRAASQQLFMPTESTAESRLWCATRLVAEAWTPVLGPEGRPIDPNAPQLHRFGGLQTCAGVGLGPLTFRMDPTALDPVWLENASGYHVIPWFTPGFHAVFAPDLRVVDASGAVVARDGTPMDPDGQLGSHPICPTRQGVYIG
jgi:hypothetical protein